MRVSDLNQKVQVLHRTKTADDLGGYHFSWGEGNFFWSHMAAVKAPQTVNERLYKVTWRSNVRFPESARLKTSFGVLQLISCPQLDGRRMYKNAIFRVVKEAKS